MPLLQGRKDRSQADALRAAQPPVQAAGMRPSRALPYELATACAVQAGATLASARVVLTFINTGRQAAVFHVYDRNDLAAVPRRYTVEPGKSLADTWTPVAGGGCDLWVLGPNGEHRHFAGSAPRAELAVRVPVAGNGYWYDLSVTVSGQPDYVRRFAGRLETGRHAIGDPALGQA